MYPHSLNSGDDGLSGVRVRVAELGQDCRRGSIHAKLVTEFPELIGTAARDSGLTWFGLPPKEAMFSCTNCRPAISP